VLVTDTAEPPQLAVVVLSVGAAPELADAVRSLLDQGVPIELAVVNSGGGDVTALLPDAKTRGIQIVSTDELLWPGAARNRGIEATSAPFVGFLAADCRAEPGWVAARLRHHLRGAPAVASAIVNDSPRNVVATAYHLVHTSSRDVNVPPDEATLNGASYARWLFDRYGSFREDLRVAEDTEFNHHRLRKEHWPVWAPEVRTVHRNSEHLWPALLQHFKRGYNNGFYWAERPHQPFVLRTRKRVAKLLRILDEQIAKPHPASRSWLRTVLTVSVLANQLGRALGRRGASPAVRLEAIARAHASARRWQGAAKKWRAVVARSGNAQGPLRSHAAALARAGEHSGAVEIHRRLAALYPDDCSVHVGHAHALLAGGSPGQALAIWDSAAARFGRRPAIVEGLAVTQLALGNAAAAELLFRELAEILPESSMVEWGLAETALARQDWDAALTHLRAFGERGNVSALSRGAAVSTYLGRPLEADKFLELLRVARGAGAAYYDALIDVLAARNDWPAIDAVLQRFRPEIVSSPTLAATVDALNMAGRSDRALELIAEAVAKGQHPHQGARLATHLHIGQTATALKVFAENPQVSSLSISSFTALAVAAYEANGAEAASALVGEAAEPGNRDALRFAAMFQSCRLESLAALDREPPGLAIGYCEERLAQLLIGVPERADGPSTATLVKAYCDVFARLRASKAGIAPDPSFVAADAVRVAATIASAVREGRAFSLVRLGDGEGNMLPYGAPYERFRPTDYAATQRVWWGRAQDEADSLESLLRAAVDGADVVGIPDLFRLSYVTSYSALRGANGRSRNVRGLVAAFEYGTHHPQALLTSCHIHQALSHWGMWDILLPQLGSVSLITCHAGLGPALGEQFGLEIACTYLVPPEAKHAAKFTTSPPGLHFPDVFESLRGPLGRVPQGHVVLVAAGMLGKIYCHWIKSAGGIALDVGSAADHWCGYNTRPAHETLAYRTPPRVRARMEELAKTDPLVASIVHLRG
jgi:tetratricopeptide (TPR) repeat protein